MNLAHELNLDGLVGPTHHYGGLGLGNVASQEHRGEVSNPRAAALEGLAKMKLLADLGLKQAVLPPQERPDVGALRSLGFAGSDADVLQAARRDAPGLLAACASASSMWAANAATVSPGADTADHRVHFTPANLASQWHRSLETPTTAALLKAIFPDPSMFLHHAPLPACLDFFDEGAANHTRLCGRHDHDHDCDQKGVELFVYGREPSDIPDHGPRRYRARHTRTACEAVARRHLLSPAATIFAPQNPLAIDAGVFHNDVICVGHRNVLLVHELAFVDTPGVLDDVRRVYADVCRETLCAHVVTAEDVPLSEAVESYLFNSQIIDLPDGSLLLLCPRECREHPRVRQCVDRIVAADNPISRTMDVDVRQSMKNGGGPACLRLRVVLTTAQLGAMHQAVLLTDELYDRLVAWVRQYYRDHLTIDDLADPDLLCESRTALDELTRILSLGSMYPFQQVRERACHD